MIAHHIAVHGAAIEAILLTIEEPLAERFILIRQLVRGDKEGAILVSQHGVFPDHIRIHRSKVSRLDMLIVDWRQRDAQSR